MNKLSTFSIIAILCFVFIGIQIGNAYVDKNICRYDSLLVVEC